MMNKLIKNIFIPLAMLGGVFLITPRAEAADRYWGADGVTLGGSGAWSTSTLNWGLTNAGPFNLTNAAANEAFFGGTAGTVAVSGTVQTRYITFLTAGFEITGGIISRSNDINIYGPAAGTINSTFSLTSGNRVSLQTGSYLTFNGDTNRGFTLQTGSTLIAGPTSKIGVVVSTGTLVLNTANSLQAIDGTTYGVTFNVGSTLASSNAGGITLGTSASGTHALSNTTGTFNFGTGAYTGPITFSVAQSHTTARTLNVASDTTLNFAGNLSSTGSYTKIGNGTLIFSGANNTYSGGTTISAGTLLVNNATGSGTGTANVIVNGGTLGGTGIISGTVTLNTGARLAPGASIESLATGTNTWSGNTSFQLEVSTDGTGTAGTHWDALNITGTLELGSLTSMVIDLTSMSNATTAGLLSSWNPDVDHTWAGFVTTTGGISGFDLNDFTVQTGNFLNAKPGSFQVVQNGNNLDLVYTVIPEPGTWALLTLAGLGLFQQGYRRRNRRNEC